MTMETILYSVADAKRANERKGGHWFEPATLRFFRSRQCEMTAEMDGAGGILWVSSEEGPSGGRRYSIRHCNPAGDVETIGDFQAWGSRSGAHAALLALVKAPGRAAMIEALRGYPVPGTCPTAHGADLDAWDRVAPRPKTMRA